jgi:hypothetical protein
MKKAASSLDLSNIKDHLVNLLTRILATRSVSEMKIVEKEIETLTAKKNEYLQLKQALKFFIREQTSEEEATSPNLPKETLFSAKSLEDEVHKLRVKCEELETERGSLKQQVSTLNNEKI